MLEEKIDSELNDFYIKTALATQRYAEIKHKWVGWLSSYARL